MWALGRAWVAILAMMLVVPARAGTVVAAPAGSAAPPLENRATLEEAARREGQLTWYTLFPEREANAMLAAFNKQYPEIKGSLFRGSSVAIAERFETEMRAGRRSVDLITITIPQIVKWNEQHLLAPFNLPEMRNYAPKYKDKGGFWIWGAVSGYGLIYNTTLVSSTDAPKSWADVLDPKWKGKLAMVPPWAADTPLEWAYMMEYILKVPDVAKRMAAQQPLLGSVGANAAQAVVSGERGVALVQDWVYVGLKAKGAPVAFLYPKEGSSITTRLHTLPARAAHPNAAKLFLNWLLSEAGQTTMTREMGYHSVRNYQTPPVGLPKWTEINGHVIDGDAVAKVAEEITRRWREAFGQ